MLAVLYSNRQLIEVQVRPSRFFRNSPDFVSEFPGQNTSSRGRKAKKPGRLAAPGTVSTSIE
jgi:hypothetical protein